MDKEVVYIRKVIRLRKKFDADILSKYGFVKDNFRYYIQVEGNSSMLYYDDEENYFYVWYEWTYDIVSEATEILETYYKVLIPLLDANIIEFDSQKSKDTWW